MDAFESIISGIFRQDGYWVYEGYKVLLTKEDKRAFDKRTRPNPVIDILAYRPVENELWWIECKSYLDSPGVLYESFIENGRGWGRYKIFNDNKYHEVVESRLKAQVVEARLTLPDPTPKYCLVAGNIAKGEHNRKIAQHFKDNKWELYDREWIAGKLKNALTRGYENNVVTMVAKLLKETP